MRGRRLLLAGASLLVLGIAIGAQDEGGAEEPKDGWAERLVDTGRELVRIQRLA